MTVAMHTTSTIGLSETNTIGYLERHEPARFDALRQHYAAQIAAVDEQIASLSD
jgi:hypothetical protein